jgi:type III secretion protein C
MTPHKTAHLFIALGTAVILGLMPSSLRAVGHYYESGYDRVSLVAEAETGQAHEQIRVSGEPNPAKKGTVQPFEPVTEPPLLMRTIGAPTQADESKKAAEDKELEEREGYVINFNDVSVAEYVRFVARITGSNFIFDEKDLQFNVTIVSEEPVTPDYIMSALLQVLEVRGLKLAEQGGQLLIYRDGELARMGTVISDQEAMRGGDEPAIMTRVFQVANADLKNLGAIIQPLLSPRALVQVSPETGHLIVTDISGNVEKVSDLLRTLDTPTPDVEVGEYRVQSTYIESLVELARKILAPLGGGGVTLVPQPMTDTIYIVGSPYLIQRTLSILEALDAGPGKGEAGTIPPFAGGAIGPGGAGGAKGKPSVGGIVEGGVAGVAPFGPRKAQLDTTTFYIYKLQYHQGDEIKEALQNISASLEASGASNTDLVGTIATIQWIKTSNSLVVSGSRASIEKVKELLQDLDIPLEQVFIEVLVLRTTIADSLRVGVEWGYAQSYVDGRNGTNIESGFANLVPSTSTGAGSPLNSRLNPQAPPAALPPSAFSAGGLGLGVVGRFVNLDGKLFSSIGSIINAVQDDRDLTIMFNPKILCQDNHTARIFVGSNVAFRQSTISEPGSTILSGDIEYRDIGSELVITPILGDSDTVTLEISQMISNFSTFDNGSIFGDSSVSSDTTGQGTTQPILKSETETRVSVPDGHFLVLSGQIQDTHQRRHRGLPCLGGLPIIGAAFADKSDLESRDNLIIFVRPHLIRSKADMTRVTESQRSHYERVSDQRTYCMDRGQAAEVLNLAPPKPSIHDHYWDPCYDHDPCDVVCCD